MRPSLPVLSYLNLCDRGMHENSYNYLLLRPAHAIDVRAVEHLSKLAQDAHEPVYRSRIRSSDPPPRYNPLSEPTCHLKKADQFTTAVQKMEAEAEKQGFAYLSIGPA
jgi:hypothetical protein